MNHIKKSHFFTFKDFTRKPMESTKTAIDVEALAKIFANRRKT